MSMVSIQGLSRAEVLAALYNAAKPQGMGFLQYDPAPMTKEEAQELLDRNKSPDGTYFDYLKGRVMKIMIPKDGSAVRTDLYDRDNGERHGENAIAELRRTNNVNSPAIEMAHVIGKSEAAFDVLERVENDHTHPIEGGIHLGLSDVKEPLKESIKKAFDIDK